MGAVCAPPLIAAIVLASNWRWVFVLAGALGFVWSICWFLFYRGPAPLPGISTAQGISWGSLLSRKDTWALVAAKFLSDGAWYFFLFWLPKYLGDVRHLDIKGLGYFAWIPYACAGFGSLFGGWFSALLMRGGLSLNTARKVSLGLAAALLPASLLITASPLSLAIVFFSMAMAGHQFFSTIMQTLSADLYEPREVGSMAGLIGAAGSFGGMLFNLIVGATLTAVHSYGPVFVLAGLMHPASFLILCLGAPGIGRQKTSPAVWSKAPV